MRTKPKRPGTLVDRLELMFEWYTGMVDERTGRLLYTCDPETNIAIGDGEPIRDTAAVWDVEVLSAFLGRDDLRDLIRRSLVHFEQRVVPRAGCAIVAPGGESSSIAGRRLFEATLRPEVKDLVGAFVFELQDRVLESGIALAFLLRARRTTGCAARERGGFGGSLTSREQRIDVTGHVASGFIKSIENGIMEPGSE